MTVLTAHSGSGVASLCTAGQASHHCRRAAAEKLAAEKGVGPPRRLHRCAGRGDLKRAGCARVPQARPRGQGEGSIVRCHTTSAEQSKSCCCCCCRAVEAADVGHLAWLKDRLLPPLDPSGSAYGQPALPSHALDALRLSLCLVRADRLGSHGAHAQQGVRRRHRPGELPALVPGSWLCRACALEAATRLRLAAPWGLCPAAVE